MTDAADQASVRALHADVQKLMGAVAELAYSQRSMQSTLQALQMLDLSRAAPPSNGPEPPVPAAAGGSSSSGAQRTQMVL